MTLLEKFISLLETKYILNEANADKEKFMDWLQSEFSQTEAQDIYDRFFKLCKDGKIKTQNNTPYSDIYYWIKDKSPKELSDYITDIESHKSKNQVRQDSMAGYKSKAKYKEIYHGNGWGVLHIQNYDAAVYYGVGTKWCIAGNYTDNGNTPEEARAKGEGYFKDYLNDGVKGYYFIIKDSVYSDRYDKWCYLDYGSEYASSTEELFFDSQDNSYGIDRLETVYYYIPEEVLDKLPNFFDIENYYLTDEDEKILYDDGIWQIGEMITDKGIKKLLYDCHQLGDINAKVYHLYSGDDDWCFIDCSDNGDPRYNIFASMNGWKFKYGDDRIFAYIPEKIVKKLPSMEDCTGVEEGVSYKTIYDKNGFKVVHALTQRGVQHFTLDSTRYSQIGNGGRYTSTQFYFIIKNNMDYHPSYLYIDYSSDGDAYMIMMCMFTSDEGDFGVPNLDTVLKDIPMTVLKQLPKFDTIYGGYNKMLHNIINNEDIYYDAEISMRIFSFRFRLVSHKAVNKIIISNKLTTLQATAFYVSGCKSIDFEDDSHVTTLNDGSFSWIRIKELTLPESVSAVNHNAFYTSDIKHLYIKGKYRPNMFAQNCGLDDNTIIEWVNEGTIETFADCINKH